MVPIWVLMMGANNLFLARAVAGSERSCGGLFVSGLMATGFLVAVLFLAQYGQLSRLWVGLLFVCVTSSLVGSRLYRTAGVQQAAARRQDPPTGDHRRNGFRGGVIAARDPTPPRPRL